MTDIFWKTYLKALITHNSFSWFPCFLGVSLTCCIIIKTFKLSNINLKDVLETFPWQLTRNLYTRLLNCTKLTEMFFGEGQKFNAIFFLNYFLWLCRGELRRRRWGGQWFEQQQWRRVQTGHPIGGRHQGEFRSCGKNCKDVQIFLKLPTCLHRCVQAWRSPAPRSCSSKVRVCRRSNSWWSRNEPWSESWASWRPSWRRLASPHSLRWGETTQTVYRSINKVINTMTKTNSF